MGKSTISMVIFNSYVKLPEGTKYDYILILLKKLKDGDNLPISTEKSSTIASYHL